MYIRRDGYLKKLIAKRDNGLIKVITGVRRCGKSFLLFNLYRDYLIDSGVEGDKIVGMALDSALNAKYRDPLVLSEFLEERTSGAGRFYVFLDEVQFVGKKKIGKNPDIYVTFYDVINGLNQRGNVDVYVTGSNSRMLSEDIATEFRGRGDILHISPLTFSEYYGAAGGSKEDALSHYMMYGGMPLLLSKESDEEKRAYLSGLFAETYFKDICERHSVQYPEALSLITDELCSAVGSLTNSSKLADTLKSERKFKIDSETVGQYLKYLTDCFLFSVVNRYDIKGRRYFSYPSKFYCVDAGLNNARLNFRQVEEPHLMENIIFNELKARGYSVDVGVVSCIEKVGGKQERKNCEIDFVVNAQGAGSKYYIQSALSLDDDGKREQELRPFLKLKNDFTRRIIITRTLTGPWTDEYGILHLGIYDFLLNEELLNK